TDLSSVARVSAQDHRGFSGLIFKSSGAGNELPTFDVRGGFELRFALYPKLPKDKFLPVSLEITFHVAGTVAAAIDRDHRVRTILLTGGAENNDTVLGLLLPTIGRLKRSDIEGLGGLS